MTRLEQAYFDRVYADDQDPWGFGTRWYEERKRAITLAALPERRYRSAYEPGCALGHLSAALADRCDALVCHDLVPTMVEQATLRVAGRPAVQVASGAIPEDWPATSFDLVVLSEVAYYLDAEGLDLLERRLHATLVLGGDVVAVHWTGETDYPSTADQVHERLHRVAFLDHRTALRDPEFRLDVWRRA